ncbi:MAG: hypothetical protein Q9168_003170 [Polycauliona sp. 1 TL-2023]
MPSLPDKSSRPSQQTSSNSTPSDQEPISEGRSSGQRSKKKHGRTLDTANRERTLNPFPKELASPPSLLSQLQASSPPLPYASNDVSSPPLAALGTFSETDDPARRIGPRADWIDNISSASSPPKTQGGGFSLAGTSPPVWQPTKGYSGGFSSVSPGTSPPTVHAKLARRTSGYQSLGGYLSSSPGRERPVSGYSQRSTTQNPPLPHYPQAHFYTAPQVDFGVPQTNRESPGSTVHGCRVFGNLASAGAEGFGGAESVLLIGLQNGLDVYSFDSGRADHVGRLGNLRGKVIGAQLLPSSLKDDAVQSLRPLVAVVIHGPQQDERFGPGQSFRNQSDEALFDPSASTMEAFEHTNHNDPDRPVFFQITVEVYSLSTSEHIATLLKSAPAERPVGHQDDSRPADTSSNGDWTLQACGRFVVIGSGSSGEVFVFENMFNQNNATSLAFKCIGKVWTSIAQQLPRSRSTSSSEAHKPILEEGIGDGLHGREGPILALSHRWLAVVPPTKSTKTTVHASVDLQRSHHKPPGLSSHTSPQSPQPTCDLDTPGQESLLNKVARDVTQEFMKGARWVGDQGIRAWKNYWQKPTDPTTAPKPLSGNARLPYLQDQLPPTHAHSEDPSQTPNYRAIVAVLDLEKLSTSQSAKEEIALQPIAAFALADGCSLVSFTPTGLSLLTASAKGDVQHVWSLMRMAHGALAPQADFGHVHKAPSVRQIARFTRMTIARIVDVVWTEPGGERLALVTERGTVHIYDLPPSALQWPPPRRTIKAASSAAQSPKTSPELETAVPANPSSGRLGSAMDMVTGRTQPLLAAVRGRPASIGNPFSGFSGVSLTAGAGIKSGKVVAAGFNRSVGAATGTVETIRHLGENRLTLPGPPYAAAPGRVRWLSGKNRGYMAVTGGETLRIHRISHSANPKPGKRRPSVAGNKPVELRLGETTHNPARGTQWKGTAGREQSDKSASSSPSFWQARAPRPVSRGEEDSLHSQAEIDTNAPYQPFHTDRRVNLQVYTDEDSMADVHHVYQDSPAWVFGEAISTVRKRTGAAISNETKASGGKQAGSMENQVRVHGNEKEGQQIVITTRRRKAAKAEVAEGAEEEIFEDDCEVVDFADERV